MLSYTDRMDLTPEDLSLLSGQRGEAARVAMRILVRMAEACEAREMAPITRVHIDGCQYVGDGSLDFAEKLVALGGRFRVPTTTNIAGADLRRWREWGTPEERGEKSVRLGAACEAMGARATYTCAPYQEGDQPHAGEDICWGESNAIVFANSVLGARTERYGDMMDICAALAGRVPRYGLHIPENRAGRVLVSVRGLGARALGDDETYPLLGYVIGRLSDDRIPVIEGLLPTVTRDQLKALGAAAASSGSVAMFHAVGITPEAPTLESALHGRTPERTFEIGRDEIAAARQALCTSARGPVDLVVLGCPHYTPQQVEQLAGLLHGRAVHPQVQLVVAVSRATEARLIELGIWQALSAQGVRWVTDTCILSTGASRPGARVLMTDSGKMAYYAPGLLQVETVIAPLADCVESAIAGAAEETSR